MASRLEDVIQIGLAADQPLATAVVSGTLYYSTDTEILERSDGTTWEAYSVAGAASGITALTGEVTATGPGSVAATIANDAVTYAKMQNTTAADILLGRGNGGGAGDIQEITLSGLSLAGTVLTVVPNPVIKLSFTIDGGGSAITATGIQKYLSSPVTGTINRVRVLADQSGSIVFDIWKDTWANRPPTNADSITAAAKPTLSAAQFYEDTTLTGWTTAVTLGDLLGIEIESSATITWAVLEIFIQPS